MYMSILLENIYENMYYLLMKLIYILIFFTFSLSSFKMNAQNIRDYYNSWTLTLDIPNIDQEKTFILLMDKQYSTFDLVKKYYELYNKQKEMLNLGEHNFINSFAIVNGDNKMKNKAINYFLTVYDEKVLPFVIKNKDKIGNPAIDIITILFDTYFFYFASINKKNLNKLKIVIPVLKSLLMTYLKDSRISINNRIRIANSIINISNYFTLKEQEAAVIFINSLSNEDLHYLKEKDIGLFITILSEKKLREPYSKSNIDKVFTMFDIEKAIQIFVELIISNDYDKEARIFALKKLKKILEKTKTELNFKTKIFLLMTTYKDKDLYKAIWFKKDLLFDDFSKEKLKVVENIVSELSVQHEYIQKAFLSFFNDIHQKLILSKESYSTLLSLIASELIKDNATAEYIKSLIYFTKSIVIKKVDLSDINLKYKKILSGYLKYKNKSKGYYSNILFSILSLFDNKLDLKDQRNINNALKKVFNFKPPSFSTLSSCSKQFYGLLKYFL